MDWLLLIEFAIDDLRLNEDLEQEAGTSSTISDSSVIPSILSELIF
jgi:hypothetical protein